MLAAPKNIRSELRANLLCAFELGESMGAKRDACKLPRRLRCDISPCQTDFDFL